MHTLGGDSLTAYASLSTMKANGAHGGCVGTAAAYIGESRSMTFGRGSLRMPRRMTKGMKPQWNALTT